MLSALRAWLWGGRSSSPTDPPDRSSRPALHQFFPADEPRPDDQRRFFSGAVLTCSPEGGTVAGDVWFEPEAVRGPRPLQCGDAVHGEAWRRDEHQAWRALYVEITDDEWGDDARRPAEKRVVGQVTRFEGEVLVLTDRDTEYRLHRTGVAIDFTPQEGDWLELESEAEIALEVSGDSQVQVHALRRWQLDGEVTFVSHEPPVYGVIDGQVYFYAAAWTLSRLPRRGDRVRCSAVESSQTTSRGVTLNWRAVHVAALEARAWIQQPTPVVTAAPSAALERLLQDKRGVSVSGDGEFGHLKCGERRTATLAVSNAGLDAVRIHSARMMSDSSEQFAVDVEAEAVVPAGSSRSLTVDCRAKLVGAGRALCVLDFGDFQIGRWLSVTVEDPDMHRLKLTAPGRRQRSGVLTVASDLDAREGCVVVPGRPAFRPAPFVSARLAPYPLPPRLLAMDGDLLLANYPCLADPLTAHNYKQKLDLLLYIEEVEMIRGVRQYDMSGVAMTRAGEYLQLMVPGLAESRPSLVVGDKALLSHPAEMNGVKFEGHVHEVRHSALLLAFHPDFQARYSGQEYNCQFEFSRSQLRQLHRAVESALARLGGDLLFPDRAPTRLPQVTFIEELTWSSGPAVCSHNKRVSFDLSERGPTPAPAGELRGTSGHVRRETNGQDAAGREVQETGLLLDSVGTVLGGTCGTGGETVREVVENGGDLVVAEDDLDSTTPTNSPRMIAASSEATATSERSCVVTDSSSCALPFGKEPPAHTDVQHIEANKSPLVQSNGTVPNGLVIKPTGHGTTQRQLSADSQTSLSSSPLISHDFDSHSITSDSDMSFASVDCSLDDSNFASASCGSLNDSTSTKRRTRRRKKMAVVERLFNSPPQGNGVLARAGGDAMACNGGVREKSLTNGPIVEDVEPETNVNGEESNESVQKTVNTEPCAGVKQPHVDEGLKSVERTSSEHGVHSRNDSVNTSCASVSTSDATATSPRATTSNSSDLPASAPSRSPVTAKPLTSPLKAAPLSRAASDLRRRALSAVGAASARRPAPFAVPRFTAAAPAGAVTPPRGAEFAVPRVADEPSGAEPRGLRLLRWHNPRLNARQRAAVRRVLKGLARPLPYIIYGPPGSGKTVTVVECILQTYSMVANSRVLVATPSNSAADLLTERLHLSGALHKASLVRLTSFNRSEESCPAPVQPYVMSADQLEAAARRRVIVGTAAAVGSLHRLGLRQGHFTHVFVDEAGHMTEPETLVALSLVSALDGQAVLAGDPQQLGPVLQSRYAAVWGLQTSMLERLSERPLYSRDEQRYADHGCYNPLLVTKLVNNYRSHRDLISVPSRLYYHSELVPCVDAELANKWCQLEWLPRRGFPLLFHGVRGENVQEGDSPSWFNPTEAFQVIRYLQKLGSAGVDWDEVGVISPYRKQTEKVRELISTFALPSVKVGSVEEFQGQEREVIILTTVRSSEVTLGHDVIYRLGFMQNRRRFNVAITRAKCLLIVVGNPHLLAADEHWRHLVVHAVTNGAAIGCDGVL